MRNAPNAGANAAPEPPEQGKALPAARPSAETLDLLLTRRSTTAGAMTEPGPDDEALALILRAGARVPDHRKLSPFRFLVFRGEARGRIGKVLEAAQREDYPHFPEERFEFEATRFERAPVVVAVISSPKDDPRGTPVWEQQLAAGAACQNMLIAASALGYAAQWLTEWYAYDPRVLKALGVGESEQVAGFIYLASAAEDPVERDRPDLDAITEDWTG